MAARLWEFESPRRHQRAIAADRGGPRSRTLLEKGLPCEQASGEPRNAAAALRRVERVLAEYFPVLLFIVVGIVFGGVLLGVGWLLGPRKPDSEKLSPYECGFEAFEDARMKFDVRYDLVAILFILFDLEIAFLFPWAVVIDEIGFFGYAAMMVFLGILVVGFVYEWKKGALEWE